MIFIKNISFMIFADKSANKRKADSVDDLIKDRKIVCNVSNKKLMYI